MRKLIIILAVFVLLFVAVLVWGVARDRDPPPVAAGEPVACKGPPMKEELNRETGKIEKTVNLDRMDEWRAKCTSGKVRNFADTSSRGKVLSPKSLTVGSGETRLWPVSRGKDKETPQQVVLTLKSGNLVRLFAPRPNSDADDDQKPCLCSGEVLMDDARDECTSDWIRENIKSSANGERGACQPSAGKAKLYFGWRGGQIQVEAIGSQVTIASTR